MPLTTSEIAFGVRLGLVVGRVIPWGRVVPTLAAKVFGSIALAYEPCRKDFRGGDGGVVYTMTQAWISNGTRVDVDDARTTLMWRRRGGGPFDGWKVYGIWCKKTASGLASYPQGVEEQTDLPSNRDTRHLGLAAKSASTGETHLVCTQTYYAPSHPNYEHPDYLLPAGIYDIDIEVVGRGGKTGLLHLEAQYGGRGTDVIVLLR